MGHSDEEPMIKGLAFSSVVGTLEKLRGSGAVQELMDGLPPELAVRIRQQQILVAGWYPVADYRELLAGLRGLGGDALLREVGAESIRSDLNSIHRMLLRMLSPSTLVMISQRMFSRYFTRGCIVATERGDNYLHAHYTDCQGWSRDIWVEQFAGAETFLQLAGVRSISVRRLQGGREGDTEALLEVRWT
ncbi:MAG: hypothetical protein KF915_17165 [Polyangiaceae bacterium]|nr:hypothetical protein [Polyangiaceae bacterium]